MTEPNTYAVTADYKLSDKMKAIDKWFEMGMAWYNYEFSRVQTDNIFAVNINSNRLNLNTKSSLGIKGYINLFTHLIE